MRDQLQFDGWAGIIAIFAFIVSVTVFVAMFVHAWRMPATRRDHLKNLPLDEKPDDPPEDRHE